MAEELSTIQSIVWMIEQLKVRGEFHYEGWAERFREGEPLKVARDDRKFHHHLRFFREEVLPVLQESRSVPLKTENGRYFLDLQLDEKAFGKMPGAANFLPFLHGLNGRRSFFPFPSPEIERQLVEGLDIGEDTLGHILYKNKFQWRFDPTFLSSFLDAIHQGKKLKVRPRPPRKPCSLTPLFVVNYDGAWYLLGVNGNLLQYNLSRIESLEVDEDEPAEEISATTLRTLRTSIETIFGIYLLADLKKTEPYQTVTVRYRKGALIYAQERFDPKFREATDSWFEVERQDSWVDLTLKVHKYDEVLSEVLRWGPDAEALRPKEFRLAWVEKIRAMAQVVENLEESE
jgi:hypothetical protein